ncbi:MAG: C39 family peptidase [Lachnospiraceae bacterium]|nr:C39 family peptidase [Lachnospiraceae bacterium]
MQKKWIKVPYIDQTKDWPTGCESVSAVMFLRYLGINITVEQFVEQYLEREPLFEKEGKLYGPDPWKAFAGDPADDQSMGCYAPVIMKALEKAMPADREVVDLTGVSMELLLRNHIDNDMPVIFWASIDLKETYSGPEWILTDTGETFTWRSNEHCMLLVGYDKENYYFNDPWHGHGMIGYEKKLVEKRHAEQYSMAVSVK